MSRRIYAVCAIVLFAIEVCIALFVRDAFVRPYVGDALAVAFVYCALRAVAPLGRWTALAISLGIAFAIEFGQLFHVLDMLGLGGNAVARIVFGYGFELTDFVAYAAGGAGVVLAEFAFQRRRA